MLERIRKFIRAQSGWRPFVFRRTRWGWDLRLPVGWVVWIGRGPSAEDWGRRLYWSADGTPVDPCRVVFWRAAPVEAR